MATTIFLRLLSAHLMKIAGEIILAHTGGYQRRALRTSERVVEL
jgi:hypothetical protein